jgi:hypothetical protein
MPTQFLNNALPLAPRTQMASYADPLAGTQIARGGASRAGIEWPAEAIVNLRLLAKGISWALAIEGATALSVCAVWYLCHLWL